LATTFAAGFGTALGRALSAGFGEALGIALGIALGKALAAGRGAAFLELAFLDVERDALVVAF